MSDDFKPGMPENMFNITLGASEVVVGYKHFITSRQ
jgi:hypothetical protein